MRNLYERGMGGKCQLLSQSGCPQSTAWPGSTSHRVSIQRCPFGGAMEWRCIELARNSAHQSRHFCSQRKKPFPRTSSAQGTSLIFRAEDVLRARGAHGSDRTYASDLPWPSIQKRPPHLCDCFHRVNGVSTVMEGA